MLKFATVIYYPPSVDSNSYSVKEPNPSLGGMISVGSTSSSIQTPGLYFMQTLEVKYRFKNIYLVYILVFLLIILGAILLVKKKKESIGKEENNKYIGERSPKE